MRLSELTEKQVREAATKVRRELRSAEDAAFSGKRADAYAAAERAQEAAFELKQLFGIDATEMPNERLAAGEFPDEGV